MRSLGSTALLFLILNSCGNLETRNGDDIPWNKARYVAHAMGSIEGKTYSNSLEAFKINYEKGFRFFETDLSLTEDGAVVARHTGDHMFDILDQKKPERFGNSTNKLLTREEFKNLPIYQKYTPITFEEVVDLLDQYPDVIFLIDVTYENGASYQYKYRNICDIIKKKDSALFNRVVPYARFPRMYNELMTACPFPEVIYIISVKERELEDIEFIHRHSNIRAVFIPKDLALVSEVSVKLNQMGYWVFGVTVNSTEEWQALQKKGVGGIYTDFLGPVDQ